MVEDTYYDRRMNDEFISSIIKDYPWIIEFVKRTPELDFQTGHDPKNGRSWFSIYRGTSRVITFQSCSKTPYKITAADSYLKIAPEGFFKQPTEEGFTKYLDSIKHTPKLNKYYESPSTGKKEGYYQNLISRRYTFGIQKEDDFIIIDKETVIGFKDEKTKKRWNKNIVRAQKRNIEKLRSSYNEVLPKEIKPEYGEFDFLAMTWDGDIIIIELKQDDPSKTALSPIQAKFYYKQFCKLLKENKNIGTNILKMVHQKKELGIINIPEGKSLPQKLSGNIRTYLIVGEDKILSYIICDRYRLIRRKFLPDLKAYTCKADGSLIICSRLL